MAPRFLTIICILAAALSVGCQPTNSTAEAAEGTFKNYNLAEISVKIPTSWKALDYDSSGLTRAYKNSRYFFINHTSKDSVRENIIIMIDKRQGIAHFERGPKEMIRYLKEQPEVRLIESSDTLVRDKNLAVLITNHRDLQTRLEIISTYGFYGKGNLAVTIMASAINYSQPKNKKNRDLFMDVINSVEWK